MTFHGLINLIRTVVWELLRPVLGAQALLSRRVDALTGAGASGVASASAGPGALPEPAPGWSRMQATSHVTTLGAGYIDQAGAITPNINNARFFFVARGGERFRSATLSSREPWPTGYVNRVRVLLGYYHLETFPVVLADLTLESGNARITVGNDVDWTFSEGEVVLVEVLSNVGLLDISVEVACPVESSPP